MSRKVLALKIDVDTSRGTRLGVPQLVDLLHQFSIPATFLFSLGPDNTGRAIARIFSKGFLKKIARTRILRIYGPYTLLNGLLWPGPHIANRYAKIMRATQQAGHEVGIHSYDHAAWQNNVQHWSAARIAEEFEKARQIFKNVFGEDAQSAGAAGWQANARTLAAYDHAALHYGSDCRGHTPFLPLIGDTVFRTPQLPTTLPTLDEMIGTEAYPEARWTDTLLSQLSPTHLNVLTLHAELEGMAYLEWFTGFLKAARMESVHFVRLCDVAATLDAANLPVYELQQGTVLNRGGTLALQAKTAFSRGAN